MSKFTAVSPSGSTVTAEAANIDAAAADLQARGYEVIDYADAATIVIADEKKKAPAKKAPAKAEAATTTFIARLNGQIVDSRTSGTMAYTHAVVTTGENPAAYSWHLTEAAARKASASVSHSTVVPVEAHAGAKATVLRKLEREAAPAPAKKATGLNRKAPAKAAEKPAAKKAPAKAEKAPAKKAPAKAEKAPAKKGPKDDAITRHIAEVFKGKPSGTFLTFREIINATSSEFPKADGDRPGTNAVYARCHGGRLPEGLTGQNKPCGATKN